MKKKKVLGRYAAIAGLLFIAVGGMALVGTNPRDAAGGKRPAHADVVLAEKSDLASTADEEQQRLIHQLLQAVGGTAELADLTIDYPLDGSVFPPEIIAPTFLWHDTAEGADGWLVDVAFATRSSHLYLLVPDMTPPEGEIDPMAVSGTNEIYEPTPYQVSAKAWKPAAEVWGAIKKHSTVGPASITFYGYRSDDPKRILSRGRMSLTTSTDPIGATIFYRDVPLSPAATKEGEIRPLPKGALPLIAWRLRDISRPASRVLLTDMPTCANCHSFSADGKTLGMDIDGPSGDKGAYALAPIAKNMVIRDEQVITWNSFPGKPQGHKTLGFLSRVSPDGRHVVSTVNESIFVVNFMDYKFGQVFYPTRGILAYYARETGEMKALPGADDPEFVHTNGVWTPDGKTIIFSRAKAKDPYDRSRPMATYAGDPNETPMQYDLYRIPFNDGRGGRPEPIAGASNNGMSNTFPKVSPDGKWIVFVQCKNGQLMRPDSKLYIIPVAGGEPRLMRCNTRLMNSWHSFSPSGRWMVFSSKSNTPYTQMFLTHIDEEGNDSPAMLIENSTAANRAVNLPEFAKVAFEDFESIYVPVVDYFRHYHRGNELAVAGRHKEAVVEFEKALEEITNESRIHNSLTRSLIRLGQHDRALKHLRESLEINPYNFEVRTNLGYVLAGRGEYEEAFKHLDMALRLYPRDAQGWYNRATLYLRQGNHEASVADYAEAIRLQPRYRDAYNGRGVVLKSMGDLIGAHEDFSTAIRLDPSFHASWYFRALARKTTGNLSGAADDLEQALASAPPDSPQRAEIEAVHREVLAALGR